jgi:hypothetical protein
MARSLEAQAMRMKERTEHSVMMTPLLRCNGGDVVAFDYLFMIHGRERETGVEEMGEITRMLL